MRDNVRHREEKSVQGVEYGIGALAKPMLIGIVIAFFFCVFQFAQREGRERRTTAAAAALATGGAAVHLRLFEYAGVHAKYGYLAWLGEKNTTLSSSPSSSSSSSSSSPSSSQSPVSPG